MTKKAENLITAHSLSFKEKKSEKSTFLKKKETELSFPEFIFPAVKCRMSQRNSFEWRGSTGFVGGCGKGGDEGENAVRGRVKKKSAMSDAGQSLWVGPFDFVDF